MARVSESFPLEDDPLWYKDAIIYEVHVRAFFDSNGDGIGDLQGLTEKLDYVQDLGITALWLLPFYPSPLRDDGYDTADFTSVHPAYGNLRDFQVLLREAHARGIRVITELVLNHTSEQHPWFQRARRAAPGSRWRDFYVWSDTPDKYRDVRIIFQDFESSNWSWDPVAKAYYWHRFYSHQPDLNYESPAVRRQMLKIVDFWMGMGVDGVRLDAVPYLFEHEGTNGENLPETHAFLKTLRQHVDQRHKNRMLLAEANQWPEDAIAYLGEGDECHMAFHFPLMPRLFMAIRMEDRFPIIEVLQNTPPIPETSQWALFLRNHDELTLEMVTDEERDYMYRSYIQDPKARINLGIRRRLAPLLGNNRRRIELMNGLLFSFAGTGVIYYGDELGMGDNIYLGDRNGVRTPMQWSGDRNAGFSKANPQRLYLPIIIDPEYHYETVNVETQKNNLSSLLWWMKRLIALRKRYKAFSRGTLEFLQPENRKVLAFVRRFEDECIVVVANLSRFVQAAEIDLSPFAGRAPVELFGRTAFPVITERPYFLTLGPHSFYWFSLDPQKVEETAASSVASLPSLAITGTSWHAVFRGRAKTSLENVLVSHIRERRWFCGKARTVRNVQFSDVIHFPQGKDDPLAYLCFLNVEYTEGEAETYLIPIAFAQGDAAERIVNEFPQAAIARVTLQGHEVGGLLFDALWSSGFCAALLQAISRRRRFTGTEGNIHVWPTTAFRRLRDTGDGSLEAAVFKGEQRNTSVIYGNTFVLKLFRRLQPTVNPDLEMGRFLTEEAGFSHSPPVAGVLEYRRGRAETMTLGMLYGYVKNQGDAWGYTLDAARDYFEDIAASADKEVDPILSPKGNLIQLSDREIPSQTFERLGTYLPMVEALGRRTAEMHVALSSDVEDTAFRPEPFFEHYQRSLYQSMRNLTVQTFQTLDRRLRSLDEHIRNEAQTVLNRQQEVLSRFRAVTSHKFSGMRTRCHGDYQLSQVLYTGDDLVIIDFEGDPASPLGERKLKSSPLKDVADMLRSFHRAAYAVLFDLQEGGLLSQQELAAIQPWVDVWQRWVSVAFLKAYRATARGAIFLPADLQELQVLLDIYSLEKVISELAYELDNRPNWILVSLKGIEYLLDSAQ